MIQLLTEYIRITYVRRWSLLLAVLLTLNGCCFGEISQLNICVKNQNFNFKSFIGKCSFSLTFNFQYLLVLILVLAVLMVKGGLPFWRRGSFHRSSFNRGSFHMLLCSLPPLSQSAKSRLVAVVSLYAGSQVLCVYTVQSVCVP